MRPIPAPRLGDAHGLLRAISRRERLRLDEFITEFTVDELFPPDLENALGRTRQFISYARAAGLLDEDRGTVELTEMGKRYVRAADAEQPFAVSPAQAVWLRRLLRERHMTDSIYHGAAVGLSLLASNPPDFRASALDFGRAISHLGRAGWDNENTFRSQGERYATFLRDLELIDADERLTETGQQTRDELTLPVHMSLKDLAGQLNPGGPEGALRDAESERAAGAVAEDEYEDVGPGAGPSPAAAPAAGNPPAPPAAPAPPAVPAPPVPPPEVWDTAAPDDHTRTYATISPPAGPPPPAEPPVAAPAPEARRAGAPPPLPPRPPERLGRPPAAPDVLSEAAAAATVASPVSMPPAARPASFVPAAAIRAAAEEDGLRLPAGVYAAVSAALAGGHIVLVGPPGSGKTTLALAVAKAAARAGKAEGATLVTAGRRWSRRDTLGRSGPDGWEPGVVTAAARSSRWLIVDELDRAQLDRALGDLSSFVGGTPVALPTGEAVAPSGWRIVATAAAEALEGSGALVRRFAHVHVLPPGDDDLSRVIDAAAGGDAIAAAAVKRLLPARELGPVGTAALLDAARFAARRNAEAPADEATLAREALAAHVAPLLGGLDEDGRRRLAALAG
jgi:MoxR-like ATPase